VNKQKIIYAFDPLCGWCFGFNAVILKLKEEYNEQLNFEVKSGGLVIGNRICKISEKAKYLKNINFKTKDKTYLKLLAK